SERLVTPFYLVELPDFAIVVAQAADGRVVVERQYKHGVGEVALFLPAGLIEEAEDPLEAARRELREETGYEADEWESLGVFTVDGNRGCGRAHVFAARGARLAATPVADDQEVVEVLLVPPDDLIERVRRGEVRGLGHVAAFMLATGLGAVRRP